MYTSYLYQLIGGWLFVGHALAGHVFSNRLLETVEEMNRKQTLKCNNPCPFGFRADVEGELTCECYDPCTFIMCLQGTVCVAEMPQSCQSGPCKPETRCERQKQIIQETFKNKIYHDLNEVPAGSFQQDDPFSKDICTQNLPTEAVACSNQRRRWTFNQMTGKCVKFMGCPTSGNNFARKFYCKNQCRYHRLGITPPIHSKDEELCSQPLTEAAFNCEHTSKRWFYSMRTGLCEKFMGCKTTGNNFSRKIFCKSKCIKKRAYSSIDKEIHSEDKTPVW
ncbi:uncharacterized protein LOC127870748 [Dreissena polymorpha]|uniref:BPTI/Kunitz inhibitor domain-containing protein n=1 Tax=Dreissena polymorpha TaxID=45954 RepID=A0A9D4LAM4_DREPO|nr:uncharacterized protein LOC127870748 [Dreissena polymorpha]KAH3854349.1 hypothetical protein DPMN_096887 [Dreissena polymorpha]